MDGASRRTKSESTGPQTDILTLISDLGLGGIIFVAPLFMGGRHPLGHLVFVFFAVVYSSAWLARQCFQREARWRFSAGEMVVLGGAMLLLLQLAPLPADLCQRLAGHTNESLPLWTSPGESTASLGSWDQITLRPTATRGALVLFFAYALTFAVTIQRCGSLREIERLLKWMALGAVGMAAFGLLQYLTSNGRFVWIYEHPFRTATGVQGSFINRNHFAQLLALGIGPLGYWVLTEIRRLQESRRASFGSARAESNSQQLRVILLAVGVGVVLFAGLSSLSRGGAAAIGTALLACGAIFCWTSYLNKKHLVGMVGIMAVVGISLFIHGYDQVANRLDDFTAMSFSELDRFEGRRKLWEANQQAFLSRPWVGHGVGSHREFYKMFMANTLPLEFTHAENGYLQVASETGIAGLALLLLGIALCGFWCYRAMRHGHSLRAVACGGAVAAGLLASLVHSVADFVWYIPACMSWTVLLMGAACRLAQLNRPAGAPSTEGIYLPRFAWIGIAGFAVLAGAWMVHDRVGPARASRHWDNYLKRSQELTELDEADVDNMLFEGAADSDKNREVLVAGMIQDLQDYLKIDPHYERAHVRLAATYLRYFQHQQQYAENAMDLTQIRDAAIASQFPHRDALNEWLDRAVGPHRTSLDRALWHARRGLHYCPLQGEGYLFLAELCFLEGAPAKAKSAYVDQALKVRPHDGYVLFLAGKEAILAGDVQTALNYWERCFHAGPRHQEQLAGLLAGRVPVQFVLENFKPTLAGWSPIYTHFGQSSDPEQLRALCKYFVEQAQHEPELAQAPDMARLWLAMFRTYQQLSDDAAAQHCIQLMLTCDGENYKLRSAVALTLVKAERYEHAEPHLRWCLARRPADNRMKLMLSKVIRGRISRVQSADGRGAVMGTGTQALPR